MSRYAPGYMVAFGITGTSNIAWKWSTLQNDAAWTGWQFKDGTWVYEPVAISRVFHEFTLFMVDSKTHALHQANYQSGDVAGSPWKNIGGNINGVPAVANTKDGVIHIFHIGTDHRLYHKYWDGVTYSPGEQTYTKVHEKGLFRPGELAAVSIGGEEVSVFAIGLIDSCLYRFHWTAANGWGEAEKMPGQWSCSLTVVSDKSGCWNLFGLNIKSGINHLSFANGKLNGLEDLGETFLTVDVISSGPDTFELFATGLNSSVYHSSLNKGDWGGWLDLRFQTAHRPTPVSHSPGAVSVVCTGKDGVVHIRSKDATWHNWTDAGWKDIQGIIFTRMAVV